MEWNVQRCVANSHSYFWRAVFGSSVRLFHHLETQIKKWTRDQDGQKEEE